MKSQKYKAPTIPIVLKVYLLQLSSAGWHTGKNQYNAFVEYYLWVICGAYKDFANRVKKVASLKMTAGERMLDYFDNKPGKVTKKELLTVLPDVSESTVERALSTLQKEGMIRKVGNGKNTGYVRNVEI
ncbi:MAG: hypothetical protein LBQ21_00520 [Clostridiales Family XIII bacterium]|nr:hypothetical protein [Clostridiales Family XIII bacterium]